MSENSPSHLDRFVAELRRELPAPLAAGSGPLAVAFAPAMLDVMGGTAEFSGAINVSWPLFDGATSAARVSAAGLVCASKPTIEDCDANLVQAAEDVACARAASLLRGESAFAGSSAAGHARAGSVVVRFTDPDEEPTFVAPAPGIEFRAVLLPGSPSGRAIVRVAAAMGYRAIAARCGLTVHTRALGETQQVEDPFFDGRLANVDPVTYASDFRDALSERWLGQAFLEQFGGVADPEAAVDASIEYPVRAATTYAIAEHQRACRVIDLLHKNPADRATRLGASFEESYLQARELGLVSTQAETFITEIRRRGAARGLLGARPGIDAVALLVDTQNPGAEQALAEVVAAFERAWKITPFVLGGTADGAAANGVILPSPDAR